MRNAFSTYWVYIFSFSFYLFFFFFMLSSTSFHTLGHNDRLFFFLFIILLLLFSLQSLTTYQFFKHNDRFLNMYVILRCQHHPIMSMLTLSVCHFLISLIISCWMYHNVYNIIWNDEVATVVAKLIENLFSKHICLMASGSHLFTLIYIYHWCTRVLVILCHFCLLSLRYMMCKWGVKMVYKWDRIRPLVYIRE